MSVTYSYSPWISMFSISIFFTSIASLICSSDVSKTTCSWLFTFSVTYDSSPHWLTWSQLIQTGFSFSISGSIFNQRLYFPVDLGCVLIIFPLFHSSLHFILYSITLPLLVFSLLSFNSSRLIWRLLLCCPSSSSRQDFIYLIFWWFYFLLPLDFQILCLH